MEYRLETIGEKKLIGKKVSMSFSQNRTAELWRSFMTQRKEIRNSVGTNLYSVQVYAPSFFSHFNPDAAFTKWAAVEVTDWGTIPEGMESTTLAEGLYAVFLHRGGPATGPQAFEYIFGNWLPGSGFLLDDRAHFEILGDRYKNDDPDSEEEIWIPVKQKTTP